MTEIKRCGVNGLHTPHTWADPPYYEMFYCWGEGESHKSPQDFVIAGETPEDQKIRQQRDASVKKLAERLGVPPMASGEYSVVSFQLEDGTRYSLDALLFAHIDLMDQVSQASQVGQVGQVDQSTSTLREELLDDAIRDILDYATGWCRSMPDAEKLDAIREIGEKALRA